MREMLIESYALMTACAFGQPEARTVRIGREKKDGEGKKEKREKSKEIKKEEMGAVRE